MLVVRRVPVLPGVLVDRDHDVGVGVAVCRVANRYFLVLITVVCAHSCYGTEGEHHRDYDYESHVNY